jgi:DNA polymerase III subunit epsilon
MFDLTIDQCEFAAIDFETAGAARGMTDYPIQIGMAKWSVHKGFEQDFVSYLECKASILWVSQKVHGITNKDLVNAPSLLSLWPEVEHKLRNAVIVAHGKGTEKRFLRAFVGHQFEPWLDTLWLSRAVYPKCSSYSLSKLCDELGLTDQVKHLVPNRHWHDALFDANASLILLKHIILEHDLARQPLASILNTQASAWAKHRR